MSAEKFVELGVMGQCRSRREIGQRWSWQHEALPSSNVRSYAVEFKSPGELHAPLKVRGMLKCEQRNPTLYAKFAPLTSRTVYTTPFLHAISNREYF